MKTVYQTNQKGIYIGEVEAQKSPLEPGKYLIPKGAVEKEPPSFDPFYQRVKWNGSSWEIIEKPTTNYWYKETKQKVEFDFGDVPDDTMTDKKPLGDNEEEWDEDKEDWVIPFTIQKQRKLDEIISSFQEEKTSGSLYSDTIKATVNGGKEDLENVRGLIEGMEDTGEDEVEFRIYDNSFKTVSLEDLKSIRKELIQKGRDLYEKKWKLEGDIEEADTEEDLSEITW